jgi:hypothetical protein
MRNNKDRKQAHPSNNRSNSLDIRDKPHILENKKVKSPLMKDFADDVQANIVQQQIERMSGVIAPISDDNVCLDVPSPAKGRLEN